jgi:hypothetical protein
MEDHGRHGSDAPPGEAAGVVGGGGAVDIYRSDGERRVVLFDDPSDSDDELAEALVQVACVESAARLQLVRLVARLDRRNVWRADCQTSMASWLTLQLGIRIGTAREIVAVASVINELPELASAMEQGRLSWDQLVPLCALATAETDAAWASEGAEHSPEDLRAFVRAKRVSDASEAASASDAGSASDPTAPGAPPCVAACRSTRPSGFGCASTASESRRP